MLLTERQKELRRRLMALMAEFDDVGDAEVIVQAKSIQAWRASVRKMLEEANRFKKDMK